jgi:hypothetical protein
LLRAAGVHASRSSGAASRIGSRLGGDVPQENPWSSQRRVSRPQWERAALDQGLIAVNSILRDWVKGQITAVETGILRGCNRLLTVFHLGRPP